MNMVDIVDYEFVVFSASFMFILCYFEFTGTRTPYSCTGQFHTDFAELCRRVEPPFVHTPAIVLRPHRPRSPAPMLIIEEKTTKTGKSNRKEDRSHPEHEKTETPLSLEKGGCMVVLLRSH